MGIDLTIYSSLRLLIFVTSFSIGLFVLSKNKKSPVNRSFFILALSISARDLSYLILSFISDIPSAIVWSKFGYCGVVFVTSATYHFIVSFLNLKRKRLIHLFYTLSFIFAFTV
ncbi:MAG: hypothetical protein KJ952_05685, partial [Candidatus Omnitrophica bacterium]|nr:hypothetical protein [Candidatus Omnitrophota bacterium]